VACPSEGCTGRTTACGHWPPAGPTDAVNSSKRRCRMLTRGSAATRSPAAAVIPPSASIPVTCAKCRASFWTSTPVPQPTSNAPPRRAGRLRRTQPWKCSLWFHGRRRLTRSNQPRTLTSAGLVPVRTSTSPSLPGATPTSTAADTNQDRCRLNDQITAIQSAHHPVTAAGKPAAHRANRGSETPQRPAAPPPTGRTGCAPTGRACGSRMRFSTHVYWVCISFLTSASVPAATSLARSVPVSSTRRR
jgi:hypothetical protein